MLENHFLNGSKFIGGERPSAADFSIAPSLAYLRAPNLGLVVPPTINGMCIFMCAGEGIRACEWRKSRRNVRAK